MNDPFANQPVHASPVGLILIDIERVLGRLHANAAPRALDQYLATCASVQFWADLLSLVKLNGVHGDTTTEELEGQLSRAECAADRAALMMLARIEVASEGINYLETASVARPTV